MKSIINLLWLMSFVSFALPAPKYKHKLELEIARMTPAQRVDEWVNEQVHHRYDLDDDHADLIKKYILRDGLAALPRMIEIIDEYDPARASGKRGRKGERFDACWQMLGYIDALAIRLRGSEEGRLAMNALERAINRMREAGYSQEQEGWDRGGRFEVALINLKEAKGIGFADEAISNTLRLEYNVLLSNEEILAFSNFMTAHYPEYPSWSEQKLITDNTQLNPAGFHPRVRTMKKPERFYEAYLEFKKTNQQ